MTTKMGYFFPETFQRQTYTISLYENRQHNDQGTLPLIQVYYIYIYIYSIYIYISIVYIQKKKKNTVAHNLGDA